MRLGSNTNKNCFKCRNGPRALFLFLDVIAMSLPITALQEAIEPVVNAMGYDFWGCLQIPQGRNVVLRIYIDAPGGIKLADCEQVSRQVGAVLDVNDLLAGRYYLEVSSPGLDRPLFLLAHYQRCCGQQVQIELFNAVSGQRRFTGKIIAAADNQVVIQSNEQEWAIALPEIKKANLVPLL